MQNHDLFDTFPTAEAAYIEAVNHCHDLASWKPSHEVVYETGRRVGFSKIRRRDTGGGKRSFLKVYGDVCKAYLRGERFRRDVVENPRPERLSAQEVLRRRVVGREQIGRLKEALRG